jgi:diguanylate cyclase (GGDEF)-like protein
MTAGSATSLPAFSADDAVRLGFLAAAEAPALEPLLQQCRQLQVEAGKVVLEGNASNSSAFVVLEGELAVKLQPSDPQSIGAVQPGELVGEGSALTGNLTSAWVIASTPARLLLLERQVLLELAGSSHHFAYRLLVTVCERLYSSNQKALSSDVESKDYRQKAFFDQLTGLKNRAWLNHHLAELLAAQAQSDTGLHFFMVDIDHFKRFNDTWGHAIGDRVLVEVGQALEAATRPGDHVVRLGGEEILVLADHLSTPAQAAAVGERLRLAVESRQVSVEGQNAPLTVTISIGAARFSPRENSDATLERADQALYRAKQAGRNRVELA